MAVTRFGVSLESDLLEALDEYVVSNPFPNRSQAIRYLIEKNLVEKKWKCNNVVVGAITLIYSTGKLEIESKIAEIEDLNAAVILSIQSIYISAEKKLKIIAVKGASYQLTELSDKLINIKGVEHGKLIMSKAE